MLLNFIQDKKVETLVVTNNNLTDASCEALYQKINEVPALKNVYFGHNQICSLKTRNIVKKLR